MCRPVIMIQLNTIPQAKYNSFTGLEFDTWIEGTCGFHCQAVSLTHGFEGTCEPVVFIAFQLGIMELSCMKEVQTQPKWNSVRVTITILNPCKHKLKSSLSRASYAATKLVGWPDDHLDVCLEMVLPLLSRRWWLLIFIGLKQHESKTTQAK